MMRKEEFRFKQFAVCQSQSAMKVGTDGVLLGAWCDVKGARRILDVGCGTGLVALMVAQRNAETIVDAIDIDAIAVDEANGNFMRSPWADRLSATVADFAYFGVGGYDAIVSNPPFFTEKVLSPDARRAAARQVDSLPLSVLFGKAYELLNAIGSLSIITPYSIEKEVAFASGEANFWIAKKLIIRTTERKSPKRILWKFTKSETRCCENELVLNAEGGVRSAEYQELTDAFYL